jgi:HD-like signal output (HDOD) protein
MREEWEMRFATSGSEALKILRQQPCDVLISDMRMPEMDGAQLLTEAMKLCPNSVRIILSGHSDPTYIYKSVHVAHQYLSKPCDPELLIGVVKRASALRNILADESLKQLISKIGTLPSLPSLYAEITAELKSPNVSLQKIGTIISKDVGMTAKILQMVNSAFFGLPRHITSPSQAVNLLGLDTIRALVLSAGIFSQSSAERCPQLSLDRLWKHSFSTGILAKTISQREGQKRTLIDDSFMGGMLHDLGKLILAIGFSKQYDQVLKIMKERNIPCWQAESEILGSTHMEAGAYLLNLWGFPDPIIETLAFHHRPSQFNGEGITPVLSVHVADALDHMNGSANAKEAPGLDRDFLAKSGSLEKIPLWIQQRQDIIEKGDKNGG